VGTQSQKHTVLRNVFCSIGLCRALFADHFTKKNIKFNELVTGTKVKILKNILAISTRAFLKFSIF
jgi:hypothetical protein